MNKKGYFKVMNLEALRSLCMEKKGTREDIKWEANLVFSIADKMYCAGGLGNSFSAGFKTTAEDYEELTGRPGIVPNKYLARYHWVEIHDPFALSPEEWGKLLEQSYQLVFSKLSKKKRLEVSQT